MIESGLENVGVQLSRRPTVILAVLTRRVRVLVLCCLCLYGGLYAVPVVRAGSYPPDFSSVIPDERRTAWTQLGLDSEGGIPTYPSITCTGLHPDNSVDDSARINACIANAAPNTAVLIPAGLYRIDSSINMKSNVVLRGAGVAYPWMPTASPSSTQLNLNNAHIGFNGGSKSANWSPGAGSGTNITTGYFKDSNSITLSSASGYSIGDYISIFEDNDPALVDPISDNFLCEDNGASAHCKQQYSKITNKVSNTLTIDRPIAFVGLGSTPQARRQTMGIAMAGIEDIKLRGDGLHNRIIQIEFSRHVWVKNVETYNAGDNAGGSPHVWLRFSYGVEVRDSYFHFGGSFNAGRNYGIQTFHWNSHHKIENNVVRETRHSIILNGGTSVSAILYNYSDDNKEGENPGALTADCSPNHGAWPHMNLWEGNDCQQIRADYVHGNTAYQTLFRNFGRGHRSNLSFTSGSRFAFVIGPFARFFNLVGNVAGQPSWTGGIGVDNNSGSSTPVAYRYGKHTNNSYLDSTAYSTSLNQQNYEYVTDGVVLNQSSGTVPPSLYYTTRPAFFGNVPWPPFGNDVTGKTSTIPARSCYEQNQMPNCLSNTALPAPSNLTVQ